jgi:hypothetical protein
MRETGRRAGRLVMFVACLAAPAGLARAGDDRLPLDVAVVPATDPWGRPWRLDVFRHARDRYRVAVEAKVSMAGRWKSDPLPPGSYQVDLLAGEGSRWTSRPFELKRGSRALVLEAPALRVLGSVLAGRRPLAAKLVFTEDVTHARVVLESGDDGLFRGHLPSPRDASWTVDVSAVTPPVSHQLEGVRVPAAEGDKETWLDLMVPAASVRGTVRAEDGRPQQNAQVLAESLDEPGPAHAATTDEEGRFELRRLPPGSYRLVAEGTHGYSDPEEAQVGDAIEPEIELVLDRRKRLVSGQVLSAAGPVPGAIVRVRHVPGTPPGSTLTDADGRFEVQVPSDLENVGITVGAPGHALAIARIAVSGPGSAAIRLATGGGTLVLEGIGPGEGGSDTAALFVTHNGGLESVDALAEWAGRNGGGPEGDRLVVPNVEPGLYRLCRMRPRDVEAVCRNGRLDGGNTLRLTAR